MKQIICSQRVLPLLIGTLIALQSGTAKTATSDDELLMFVEVSQPKPQEKPAAVSNPASADEMMKRLAAHTQSSSAPKAKASKLSLSPMPMMADMRPQPGSNSIASDLKPEMSSSVPVNIVSGSKRAPVSQATASTIPRERQLLSQSTFNNSPLTDDDLPVFKPASAPPRFTTLKQDIEPALTPAPDLSVTRAPQTIQRASPDEMELKNIFFNAVMTALQRSPQMRSSQLQIEAAKEDVSNVKGQRWPQVDVTSNSRRYEFGKGNRNASDSNTPAFGVNVATNLIDFGQTSNTIKSKEYSVKAADFQNTAQMEELAWQVSSNLIELNKQRLIIDMSKQYVARMQELVSMLSGIVSADPGRRSELTQATGRFLQAQSALDNAVSKARDTEIQLYRLLGETQVPLPPAIQWHLQPSNLNALLAHVEKHPALAKAQAQSQAAFAEADALKSSALPKINWVVSKDTGKDYYGREQSWQTGINVSWGLFRGGSVKAAEQAAIQRASAMREESEEQRNDLEQRVRASDQDARSMLQRADLYRNLTRESDRIRLDFFDQWYHLGKRTLLDVLSAESDYYNNRVAEVTNRFDGYSAIFRSYASAGQLINWLKNGAIQVK